MIKGLVIAIGSACLALGIGAALFPAEMGVIKDDVSKYFERVEERAEDEQTEETPGTETAPNEDEEEETESASETGMFYEDKFSDDYFKEDKGEFME